MMWEHVVLRRSPCKQLELLERRSSVGNNDRRDVWRICSPPPLRVARSTASPLLRPRAAPSLATPPPTLPSQSHNPWSICRSFPDPACEGASPMRWVELPPLPRSSALSELLTPDPGVGNISSSSTAPTGQERGEDLELPKHAAPGRCICPTSSSSFSAKVAPSFHFSNLPRDSRGCQVGELPGKLGMDGEEAVVFWLASLCTYKSDPLFPIQSSIRKIRCVHPSLFVFIICTLLLKL
jgi:hypothetical protein